MGKTGDASAREVDVCQYKNKERDEGTITVRKTEKYVRNLIIYLPKFAFNLQIKGMNISFLFTITIHQLF